MFAQTISFRAEGLTAILIIFGIGILIVIALCVLVLPAYIIAAVARRKAEQFKKAREGIVIAQYDPPAGLTPAELGYLYDLTCNKKEIRATLFDLEQRGVIRLLDKNSISVIDSQALASLSEHERLAVNMTLANSETLKFINTSTDTTDAAKVQLPAGFNDFQLSVRSSLAGKGYILKDQAIETIKRVLLTAFIISLWPLLGWWITGGISNGVVQAPWSFAAFITGISNMLIAGFFFWLIYLVAGYLLVKLWIKIAGRLWMNTKEVRRIWYEIEGYRLFLKQVEIDNIQFDATNKYDRSVNKALPYAIALNLDTKWQLHFK